MPRKTVDKRKKPVLRRPVVTRAVTVVPARKAVIVRRKRLYEPVRMINNPRGHVARYAQNISAY